MFLGKSKRARWFAPWAMAFFLTFFAFRGTLHAVSSVNVPLHSWTYDALDKLTGFGLIHSDIHSIRPYTRLEMARLVKEALDSEQCRSKKLPPLIEYLLEKFQCEFKMELKEVGPGEHSITHTFLKPIEEAQAQYVYVQGEPHRFDASPELANRLRAIEGTPLLPYNAGLNYTQYNNFSFQFAASARYHDIFSAYLEPVFVARENDNNKVGADSFEADLLKGYVKISPWNIELEAGRDTLWWGQGYRGTLLLTDNAEALNLVKLSNPTPFVLPWYFHYLGLVKYSVFFAQLEDDRVVPHPYFGGLRVAFKPHPLFEFAATSTFIFGGEGRPSLSFSDFLGLFRIGSANPSAKANQIASLDARLRLPCLWNAEIYAEYGGEDTESTRWYEFLFRDVAYLVGVYFPCITPDGRTDLRVEYANNAFHRGPGHVGVWYGNSIFSSGYTYEGQILGHYMGPDALDVFGRTTRYVTDRWKLGVDYEYLERGKTLGPMIERTNAIGADLTYDINACLSISGRYTYGTVSNFDYVKNDDRNDQLVMTTINLNF